LVEQDLGERIDRASEQPELVEAMRAKLLAKKQQMLNEASFWDQQPDQKK
jgi:hypothetical protein